MDKSIIITGGSSGIGLGIANYFYEKGWKVLITGRNIAKLEQIALKMPGINIMVFDSAKEGDHLPIAAFVKENWQGKLNILVNNAGNITIGPLQNISSESMQDMFRSHVLGPTLLASACLEFLTAAKGQILNTSSSGGIKPYPNSSAYGAAKASLNMLTKIWALELAPLGIRVNAIAPGPTDTDILKSAGFDEETIRLANEGERAAIPLQRRGRIQDIVAAAVFFLDSDSDWATGVLLPIDGGISIS
ncbi:SDR family NAD(P)-dependent oxidoreductase [Sphingobacterium sp. HMA12]|uniref:SDR family NAD(P)-dependent oxidoreductase n=1 Tax=Sphingobacterium sp. HMA12 TaxID=2050894 RepID=UPI000CEA518A|nr:SDR family oxidoreductase [Sphingobacterium sp. HMA12]